MAFFIERNFIFLKVYNKNMKIKTPKEPNRLLSYWSIQWPWILLSFVCGLIFNIGSLVTPYFETILINTIENKSSFSMVETIVFIYILAMIVVEIARMGKRYFVRLYANKTQWVMRYISYNNLLHMSLSDVKNMNMGNVLSSNISDISKTVEGMRKVTTEIYDTILLFFFYIGYMMIFDVKTTFFALIPVFISILISYFLRKPSYQFSVEARKQFVEMSNQTFDSIDNALLYQLYSRNDDIDKKFNKILGQYEKKNRNYLILADSIAPIGKMVALFGLIPVVYFSVLHVTSHDLLPISLPFIGNEWNSGVLSGYIMTFVLMATKASNISRLFTTVENGKSSWEKIQPYLKPIQSFSDPKEVVGDTLNFKEFCIKTEERILIDNLNFTCKKGQIIGVTGGINSGKSLLGKALLKQFDYDGNLELFGKEIKEFTNEEIQGTISYMGHKSELFTMTIKDNIAFGEMRDVTPYLQMVDFDEDFTKMEKKEETIIGNEGVRLSGGQQQRIALARTLYHHKSLIILDDPFSSVDYKTEKKILTSLQKWKKDAIIIFISHRLRIFPELDQILVLHKDGYVSIGSHDQLLQTDADYQKFYELQQMEGKEHE